MLSPANAPEPGPLDTALDVVQRVLPSARELAEVHSESELKHLRGVATGLGDIEVAQLFERAGTERRRIEVETALATPNLVRQKRAEWARQESEFRANALTRPVEGLLSPADYLRFGQGPAAGPFASAQSAGPSE